MNVKQIFELDKDFKKHIEDIAKYENIPPNSVLTLLDNNIKNFNAYEIGEDFNNKKIYLTILELPKEKYKFYFNLDENKFLKYGDSFWIKGRFKHKFYGKGYSGWVSVEENDYDEDWLIAKVIRDLTGTLHLSVKK